MQSLKAKFLSYLCSVLVFGLLLQLQGVTHAASPYGASQCAASRFGSDLNCTANDVSINTVTVVGSYPASCVGGQTLPLDLDVTVNFGQATRYNIGVFIANDGGNPQWLPASGGAASCSVGILPTSAPFRNFDGGSCGDGTSSISGTFRMYNVAVPCTTDDSGNAILNIPYLVSWDQSSNYNACTSNTYPVPGSPSKCNTGSVSFPPGSKIVVLPTISITDGVTTVTSGGSTTYTIVITNTTGGPLNGALFKDPALTNFTANSVTCTAGGGAACPASPTIAAMQGAGINLPDMPNNSTLTFTVQGTVGFVATPGTLTNTASVIVGTASNSASDTDNIIPPLAVTSIVRASPDPAEPGTSVSWTVTFNRGVTGVDAADFALAAGGGVTGATLTSVTGVNGSATRTVTATTGSGSGTLGLNLVDNDTIVDGGGLKLGGTGAGNGNFTGQVYSVQPFCTQPANTPPGLTCVCDTFGRASLNPSTIFGGNWVTSNSDGLGDPYINAATGLLRLTEKTNNNAKAATVPSIFPAAGNYISVEFRHYAYNGNGADGIAVTLSDSAIPAAPGGFGGSLGYAQRNDGTKPPGFQGGWIGVALDEFGNYQNPTEGRVLGSGFITQSVGVRGPGSGANGYRWLGGTPSNPGGLSIDNDASTTPSPGYMYQVIVDATQYSQGTVNVNVNRDASTKNGSNYTSLFGPFNAYNEASYAVTQGWISKLVPNFWKISFTGSTGASINIHEIGSLRVCAQTLYPVTGGTASGFAVIDEAYPAAPNVPAFPNFQTGNIYMKVAGKPFKTWVGVLNTANDGLQTAYSATQNKYLSVKFVNNSDNVCGADGARTCNAACAGKAAVESGASQNITFPNGDNKGARLSSDFTLNTAWKNLVAVVRECTTSSCAAFTSTAPACSADSFSVRPTGVTSVTSSNADMSKLNLFRAGSGAFALTATTTPTGSSPSGYNGKLKINSAALQPQAVLPAAEKGTVSPPDFPNATPGTPSSSVTSNFTYSEVGTIVLLGYGSESNPGLPRSVYDGVDLVTECNNDAASAPCDNAKASTWTYIDSISGKNDCIDGSYSNVKSADGKYGCNFGLLASSATMGRFIPDHFDITGVSIVPRSDAGAGAGCLPTASTFTYMGEPFRLNFTLRALNAGNVVTKNYTGAYAKLSTTNWLAYGTPDTVGLWMMATGYPVAPGTCNALFSNATPFATSFACSAGVTAPSAIPRAAGSRVTVVPTPAAPNWIAGQSAMAADLVLERADKPDGPYATLKVGIAPQDQDGVTIKMSDFDLDTDNSGSNERKWVKPPPPPNSGIDLRYGRLLIPNMYGSELLDLRVDLTAQYWGGTSFLTNVADSCTVIPAANFTITPGNGNSVTTAVGWSSGTLVNGGGALKLNKPTNTLTSKGSIILKTSTTAPVAWPIDRYLPGLGVETFGVFKSGPVIYLREVY